MPYTDHGLPFASSESPVAAHCSHQGAIHAERRAGPQVLLLLAAYATYGPMTDAEAAKRLGLERSTINARRVPLRDRGIVVAVDTVKNPVTQVRNTRWGLAK
jgi:hypothetical protein